MARRRRGRYRMTPRRRAALKKAQAASARKRRNEGRKQFFKTVGNVAGTIAVGAIIYQAEQAARHPTKIIKGYNQARSMFSKGRKHSDPNAPKARRPQPLNRHRLGPIRPIRNGVAGRRISARQRRAIQGRLF